MAANIKDFLEEARDDVRADVLAKVYSTPTFWRAFMPTGAFELGKGYQQRAKFYEEPVANDHQPWTKVQDLVDANTACDIKAEEIRFGRSFINFELETLAVKSPNFCLYDAIIMQDFRADLSQAVLSMGQITVRKLENRYRNAYLELAGRKYLMSAGLPYLTGASFPTGAGQTIGKMHESVLSHIASYFDAMGGYTQNAMTINGAPYYWAIGHHSTWDELIRSDAVSREDIRMSSQVDELLRVIHPNYAYKRFILVNDSQAARFTYDVGVGWTRVPYFIESNVDLGVANVPNPDWETAPYEAVIFVANRLGPKALWLPTSAEVATGTEFGPLHTNLEFRWINKATNDENPLMWSGYFLGNASLAISPEQNRFVVALMVARNINTIVITEPDTTAMPVLAPLVTVNPEASPVCTLRAPIPCAEDRTLDLLAANVDTAGATDGQQLTYDDATDTWGPAASGV